MIINRLLYSLSGQEEGINVTTYDNIISYHHYTKGIKGCTPKTFYTLAFEFMKFLISFKDSMLSCFDHQYYDDLLAIKELAMDYTESDTWLLEESHIIDLFNQMLSFDKKFVIKNSKITNRIYYYYYIIFIYRRNIFQTIISLIIRWCSQQLLQQSRINLRINISQFTRELLEKS